MTRRFWSLFLFLILALPLTAHAQTPDSTAADSSDGKRIRLVLSDGSTLIGQVTSETDSTLQFRTVSGSTLSVEKRQITERERLFQRRDGRYLEPDPSPTRLVFTPTGRPLGQGNGYFSVYQVFFPFLAVGVTDRVSVAGGLSLIPGVSGQLFYFAPKVTLAKRPRNNTSVGMIAATVLGEGEGVGGVVFGLHTLGRSSGALTGGVGVAFGNEGAFTEQPVFVVGGEYQVGNHAKLVTENYVFSGQASTVLVSGGIRFFGDHVFGSLSFFTAPEILGESEGFPFVPFISFGYNF